MKKRLLVITLILCIIATSAFSITNRETNMDIMNNGQSLYGKNTSGVPKQVIGTNTSGLVSIDEDAVGTAFGGTLAPVGDLNAAADVDVAKFIRLTVSVTSVEPDTADSGLVTVIQSYTTLDTSANAAVNTVNRITTANIDIGSILVIQSELASQDIVLTETGGNLILGATTRTLTDPADKLMLIKASATEFQELSFVDVN